MKTYRILLLSLAAVVLVGCSFLARTEAFLNTPIGADLLAGVASAIVGTAEQHGTPVATINAMATQLAAVDSTEPASMATIAAIVQAHMANTPVAKQAAAAAFLQAINLSIGDLSARSSTFAGLQTTSSAFLQAIKVASSPNPQALPAATRTGLNLTWARDAQGRLWLVIPGQPEDLKDPPKRPLDFHVGYHAVSYRDGSWPVAPLIPTP